MTSVLLTRALTSVHPPLYSPTLDQLLYSYYTFDLSLVFLLVSHGSEHCTKAATWSTIPVHEERGRAGVAPCDRPRTCALNLKCYVGFCFQTRNITGPV